MLAAADSGHCHPRRGILIHCVLGMLVMHCLYWQLVSHPCHKHEFIHGFIMLFSTSGILSLLFKMFLDGCCKETKTTSMLQTEEERGGNDGNEESGKTLPLPLIASQSLQPQPENLHGTSHTSVPVTIGTSASTLNPYWHDGSSHQSFDAQNSGQVEVERNHSSLSTQPSSAAIV